MPPISREEVAYPRSPASFQTPLWWLQRAACTAAFVAVVAGCGGASEAASDTGTPAAPAPAASAPAAPAPAPAAPAPAASTPAASSPAAPTPDTHASAGCGSAAKFTTGMQSLTSDGVQRSYWVEMPANYDRSKTYPVVIGLHWRGGSAEEIYGWSGFFGLKSEYGSNAIFVAPQGLDAGWANTNDRDIRFLRAMIGQVQQGACTDTQRVFATGFSFGGMMSNAIGCQMGDVVRAIVPMAGSLWSGCGSSTHRVAALFIHAQDDTTVPYSAGEEARNVFIARNSCSATTVPLGSNGCVEYQGCSAGKPVVWCGTATGGHWYPGFSAKESKTFFDRF